MPDLPRWEVRESESSVGDLECVLGRVEFGESSCVSVTEAVIQPQGHLPKARRLSLLID